MATVEELFLLAQIARGLGSGNIDHRLRQLDFRAQENEAAYPHLGLKIADVEQLEGVLIVGSDLRHEMPMLAHRLRKAVITGGAQAGFLEPRRFDYTFPLAGYEGDTRVLPGRLGKRAGRRSGLDCRRVKCWSRPSRPMYCSAASNRPTIWASIPRHWPPPS